MPKDPEILIKSTQLFEYLQQAADLSHASAERAQQES